MWLYVAVRGAGCMIKKNKAVQVILRLLRNSKYWSLFGDKWNDAEFFSLIAQPFIISPAINVCDIAVIKIWRKKISLYVIL